MAKATPWLKMNYKKLISQFGKPKDGKIETLVKNYINSKLSNASSDFAQIARAYETIEDWKNAAQYWELSAVKHETDFETPCSACQDNYSRALENLK